MYQPRAEGWAGIRSAGMNDAPANRSILFLADGGVRDAVAWHMVETAGALHARGHAATICAVDSEALRTHAPTLERTGVTIRTEEALTKKTVRDAVEASGATLIRVYTDTFPPSAHLAKILEGSPIPVLESLHAAMHGRWPPRRDRRLLAKRATQRYRALALTRTVADACTARFPAMKGWLHLVPYGIEPPSFENVEPDPPPEEHTIRFVTLTRINERVADVATLLLAFAWVRDALGIDDPRPRLRIIGDGRDREKMEWLAGRLGIERICTFAGWVDDPRTELLAADAFVLATHEQAFKRINIDAAAAGTPVITSDIPVCRDTVSHDVNGLLVPPENAQALRDAMLRIVYEKDLRTAFAEASPRFACEHGMDRHIDAILRIADGLQEVS